MNPIRQPARIVFAIGIIALGSLGFVYGDFASAWPAWVPFRQALLYGASAFMMLAGAGVLVERTALASLRILLPYLAIWMLLRVPAVVTAPQEEGYWFGVGEIAVLVAGAWLLIAQITTAPKGSIERFLVSARGQRIARVMFALSLLAFGPSHFVYLANTVKFIPAWLPFPIGWAYLTGAAHTAAGLGILFSVYARLAAFMEAGMLTIFTLGVWIPELVAKPTLPSNWSEFAFSWAITASAWVVARSIGAESAHAPRAPID
jgi:uncharacterized membrane protein